jgi:hypothetical protein
VPMNAPWPIRARTGGVRSRRFLHKGFILLMSLVLIALVGILLVSLARHSLLISAEAREARFDLQRRWGTLFLAKALLSEPATLVARYVDAEAVQERQLPIRVSVRLGELTFRVALDDENRKLNLNRLRQSGGSQQLLQTVQRFAGAARVDLRPLHASTLGVRPFDSWGHVLELAAADDAAQQLRQVEELSQVMTCWGSAKVNLHRCGDEVLRTVGTLAAGPVTANRLVALRESAPAMGRDELLTKLATDARKLAVLKGWLSDDSDCYSLWIVAGDRRSSLELFVRENVGAESPTVNVRHFQW